MGFFTRLPDTPRRASDHQLRALMTRVSRGDQQAFVLLVEQTSADLHARLLDRLRDAQWAADVVAATYVEVWWLAGCYTDRDSEVRPWITRIAARRVAERPLGDRPPSHAVAELAALLGRSAGVR